MNVAAAALLGLVGLFLFATVARVVAPRGRSRRLRVMPFLLACGLLSVFHFAPTAVRDANTSVLHEPITAVAGLPYADVVTASPDGRHVYVGHANPPTILILDTATNGVAGRVSLPKSNPDDMAFAPNGSRLYLADGFQGTVSTINTATNAIISTVAVAESHHQRYVAVTPNGRRIYAAATYENTVSVINARSGAVIETITLGDVNAGNPRDIAITPDGRRAYVTNGAGGTVSVIDTSSNTVATTIRMGGYPDRIVMAPDGRYAYVSDSDYNGPRSQGIVSVIDTAIDAVSTTIPIGENAGALAITGDGSKVFAINEEPGREGWGLWLYGRSSDSISVIATASKTVVQTINFGDQLSGIASNFDGSRLYVADSGFSTVSVLEP